MNSWLTSIFNTSLAYKRLSHQVVIDAPAAKFPEETDDLLEAMHYNQTPSTYGVPGEQGVPAYYGPLFHKE